MKDENIINLYNLVENSILSRVALSTIWELDSDDTKLSHSLLGHLGEWSIVELYKRNLLKIWSHVN